MRLKNLIKNTLCVFSIAMLFSTQSFSQLFCELGPRDNFYPNGKNDEYSGLAYHIEREIFFMPVDDPIQNVVENNIHFKGYTINSGDFNVALSDPNALANKKDFEGLTYLEKDYFVVVEEKENKVYFLEYKEDGSNNPIFEVLSGHQTGIPSAEPNDGLEGVSYDPHTKRLYVVREKFDVRLFSIPITLPNSGFLGDIDEQQISSVALPANEEPSGLFHLGKVYPSSSDLSNNLLVVDDQSFKIFEYELELDSDNNLVDNLLNPLNPVRKVDIRFEPKPEGVVVYNNTLYIASEDEGGGLSSYTINPSAALCNTDCTKGKIKVWNAEICTCELNSNAGCTNSKACNFDELATIDDCSCLYKKAICDDGNDKTINDRINENCKCKGIQSCQCQHAN